MRMAVTRCFTVLVVEQCETKHHTPEDHQQALPSRCQGLRATGLQDVGQDVRRGDEHESALQASQ